MENGKRGGTNSSDQYFKKVTKFKKSQREEVKQLTIRLSWRISRETFNGRSFESTTPFTKLKYLGNWPESQFSIIRYQIYLVLNKFDTNHEEWLMREEHTNSPSKSSDMNTRLTYSLIFLVFLLSVISSFLVAGTKRIDLNSTSPCVKEIKYYHLHVKTFFAII
jgi:hypothetical protein